MICYADKESCKSYLALFVFLCAHVNSVRQVNLVTTAEMPKILEVSEQNRRPFVDVTSIAGRQFVEFEM